MEKQKISFQDITKKYTFGLDNVETASTRQITLSALLRIADALEVIAQTNGNELTILKNQIAGIKAQITKSNKTANEKDTATKTHV